MTCGNRTLFSASQFTPTQFSTAQDKADFCNKLARFVLAGCPERLFTQSLYRRLSLTFHHIAHYNRQGFWDVWLADLQKKIHFLDRLRSHTPVGDPAYTFSDAERAFVEWLRKQEDLP